MSMTLLLVLFLTISAYITAFESIDRRKPANMRLNAWGLQKLGQPVGINIETAPETTETTPFGEVPATGTGVDERKTRHSQFPSEEADWSVISKIDGMFRKQALLMTLETEKLAPLEKMEHIRLAAEHEGLLPETFSSSCSRTNMHSAGLMDEWEFDL